LIDFYLDNFIIWWLWNWYCC